MSIDKLFIILLSDKPSILLKENEEELFNLISELKACKGFNQNNKWHIYDVYEHILHVVDNIKPTIELRLAALFHDIGKPLVYSVDEKGIGHFYGHFKESKEIFDRFAINHNLDINLKNKVDDLIYYHDLKLGELSDKKLRKLCDTLKREEIINLFELKKADLLAQNSEYHYILDEYDKELSNILKTFD